MPCSLAGLEDLQGVACQLCPPPLLGTAGRWAAAAAARSPACPSGGDLQSSHCTLGEAFEDLDWEAEKGLEAVACDAEGFLPPKVMVRTDPRRPQPVWGSFSTGACCLPGREAAAARRVRGCLMGLPWGVSS